MEKQTIATGNVGTVHGEGPHTMYRVLDARLTGPALNRAVLLQNIKTGDKKIVDPRYFWPLLDSFDA